MTEIDHDHMSQRLTDDFLVKVCGITNAKDAFFSVDCGANALGFNFYKLSPRYLDPQRAAKIIKKLPGKILVVAVMVVSGETREEINNQIRGLKNEMGKVSNRELVDVFQLHGLESESQIPLDQGQFLVAASPLDVGCFPRYEVLIDTSWGTGTRDDWDCVQQLNRSFILSGGLTPENVSEAIALLGPSGVDVCSGVESELGIKDSMRLKRFIHTSLR